MNRRDVLSAAALSMSLPGFSAFGRVEKPAEPPVQDEEPKVLEEIALKLSRVGTKLSRGSRTPHYLVFNDVSQRHEAFLSQFCESLLAEEIDAFRRCGLLIRPPTRRLTVVALDREIFVDLAKLEGISEGAAGFYSWSTRTCFFARRNQKNDSSKPIDWESTLLVLSHEATHQISYNTGLLDPSGDAPACVVEGLALVAECNSMKDVPKMLRQVNRLWLGQLTSAQSRGLVPLDEFLCNDDHLWSNDAGLDDDRWRDAYAWAWLLIFTLLTQDDLRPKFQAYLNATAKRKDKSQRLSDARHHLGNLDELQDRLLRRLHWLFANPPSRFRSYRRPEKTD